jgi:plastocyanin
MLKPGINATVGVVLLLVAFGISAPLLYGGTQLIKSDEVAADTGGGGGGGATGGPAAVTVIAQNLSFSLKSITVSSGVEVTVTLDNRDAGVLHNIAFYTSRAATTKIFGGKLTTGPAVDTEKFTAPSTPGTYYFHCDVHPDQMNGTFIVQ